MGPHALCELRADDCEGGLGFGFAARLGGMGIEVVCNGRSEGDMDRRDVSMGGMMGMGGGMGMTHGVDLSTGDMRGVCMSLGGMVGVGVGCAAR